MIKEAIEQNVPFEVVFVQIVQSGNPYNDDDDV